MNTKNITTTTEFPASHTQWTEGFNAYMQREALESMPTEQHRRGWWSALSAGSNAETDAHLARRKIDNFTK